MARMALAPTPHDRWVLSIVGSERDPVERVVRSAYEALSFEKSHRESPWHAVQGLTHDISDFSEDFAAAEFRDRVRDRIADNEQRAYIGVLGSGSVFDPGRIALLNVVHEVGWPILYLLEDERTVLPPGVPSAPVVVAPSEQTISEAVRLWVRAIASTGTDSQIEVPEASPSFSSDDEDAGRAVALSISSLTQELVDRLARRPELMYQLDPRAFEELVAELLVGRGYEVTLTPFSRDRGRDVIAVRHDDLGAFLLYVECKRWAPHRLVGPEILRALYGVVEADKATAGVVATTSSFTRGAREFQRSIRNRLSLRDFFDMTGWLREHRSVEG